MKVSFIKKKIVPLKEMVPKFSGNKSCKNQESSFDYWLKVNILPFSNERGKMLSCHEIMLFMEVE